MRTRSYYVICTAFILCIVGMCVNDVSAQIHPDSAYKTSEIEILQYRYDEFPGGAKTVLIDSFYLKNNPASLSDILASQSGVYMKTYGASSIASISIRGSSASQTQATVNGLNVNSVTLGQADYSAIPSFLFNNIGVQYGSQVALMGSGAIGGSVHLSNTIDFRKRKRIGLVYQHGSYESNQYIADAAIGDSTKQLVMKVYYKAAVNNYTYSYNQVNETLDHAQQQQAGIYLDYTFRFKNHVFQTWLWYQQFNRNLPGTMASPLSDARQFDRYFKQGITWSFTKNRSSVKSRAGYQNDLQLYDSDSSHIHSRIPSQIWQIESEYRYTLTPYIDLLAGSQCLFQRSLSMNFKDSKAIQNRIAFFAAAKIRLVKNRIEISPAVRKEWSTHWLPFTPSVGLTAILTTCLKVHSSVSYNYRIPTLNDLYWVPGGNTELKPESGWGYEAGIDFEKKIKSIQIFQDITVYSRAIRNWIIWTPSNGIWSPDNIQNVWSRGVESESSVNIPVNRKRLLLRNSFAYTRSTNESDLPDNDVRKGKQLIYVPLYKNSSSLSIAGEYIEAGMVYNYTSWSFFLTDNSDYINPFHVFDVFGMIKIHPGNKKYYFSIYGKINNLFNASYQVVADRPMPLRNYQLTIHITYN